MAPHAEKDTIPNDGKSVLNGKKSTVNWEKPTASAQKTLRTGKGKEKGKGEAANKERLQRFDQL
jgi:hypothetical protein